MSSLISDVPLGALLACLCEQRFETLYEKNSAENGGSFYVRSKIYFAKEHLMQDWPEELNVTKFDRAEDEEREGASAAAEEADTASAAEEGSARDADEQ